MRRGVAVAGLVLAVIAVAVQPGSAGPILHACRDQGFHRPVASAGRPPDAVMRRLAVLRHGARAHLSFREFFPLHRVAVRYVRRLANGYYLVPATLRPSPLETPALCHRHSAQHAERRRERRALHSYGLYLVQVGRDGSFNTPHGLGARTRELFRNKLTYDFADESHTWLSGVVPDGIASVRLRFKDGHSRTKRVARNFWVVRVDESIPPDVLDEGATEWLGPDGSVLRSFHGV
jgi:hypothetical protein